MEEESESEAQALHITSSEDEKQTTPSPKRGNITSKVSRHVLSEAKRTSMSIIILEGSAYSDVPFINCLLYIDRKQN